MSNLTKVLIVLLTISAIFLCGIVVTYVANADDYKNKYGNLRSERDSLEQKAESLTNHLNEKTRQSDELEKSLRNEIATLKTGSDELRAKLSTAEREKSELLERVNSWASITKDFEETTKKHTETLNAALEEVKQLKAEQIKMTKELEETSAALVEKSAVIESLNTDKRRLTEEKADLENRLDGLLRTGGREPAASTPVTQESGPATSARPGNEAIGLKGKVIEVDTKSSLATISIGSADGVKEGMRFHITRDDFICDMLIIDVDTDKAVGILELIKQPPKVGDNAVTNL